MEKYRDILAGWDKINQIAKKKYDTLKEKADKADVIVYGTKAHRLGLFSPSLIDDKLGNYSKGRIIRKFSKEIQSYNIYESTDKGEPLRLRKYGKFGCDVSYYFFNENNATHAVPFFKETNKEYYAYTYSAAYESNKLMYYAFFNDIQIVLEEYDYSQISDNSGIIVCKYYNIVDPSINGPHLDMIEARKRFEEFYREKYNREAPSVSENPPKIDKWLYKLYYENDILLRIEEFCYRQGIPILSRVINVAKRCK